jgi:hypothetical protein
LVCIHEQHSWWDPVSCETGGKHIVMEVT